MSQDLNKFYNCNAIKDGEADFNYFTKDSFSVHEAIEIPTQTISAVQKSMEVDVDHTPAKVPKNDDNFQLAILKFEMSGEYTPSAKIFIKSLNAIKPTSTEAERMFSGAGRISQDRRASISINLLNAIIVVNKFYKS